MHASTSTPPLKELVVESCTVRPPSTVPKSTYQINNTWPIQGWILQKITASSWARIYYSFRGKHRFQIGSKLVMCYWRNVSESLDWDFNHILLCCVKFCPICNNKNDQMTYNYEWCWIIDTSTPQQLAFLVYWHKWSTISDALFLLLFPLLYDG